MRRILLRAVVPVSYTHLDVYKRQLLSVAVLVLMNGFFVAAEFALVGARRARLEQMLSLIHIYSTQVLPSQR